MTTPVVIEVGKKRCFATALAWPGWCRPGPDEGTALANLVAYGDRYVVPVASVAPEFTLPASVAELEIVEHLVGSSSTEFGTPGAPTADSAPVGVSAGPDRGRR